MMQELARNMPKPLASVVINSVFVWLFGSGRPVNERVASVYKTESENEKNVKLKLKDIV